MADMTDAEVEDIMKAWKRRKASARMDLAQAVVNTSGALRTTVEASFETIAEPIGFDQALEIAAYIEGIVNDYHEWYREIRSEVVLNMEQLLKDITNRVKAYYREVREIDPSLLPDQEYHSAATAMIAALDQRGAAVATETADAIGAALE